MNTPRVMITDNDAAFMKNLSLRLYSERRMTADEMRDAAHSLRLILENAVRLSDDDLLKL